MGGLALDTLSLDAVGKDAQIWEKAVRKLRGRLDASSGRQATRSKRGRPTYWLSGDETRRQRCDSEGRPHAKFND